MTTIGQCQALKLIKEDQECKSFTKWQVGMSPKEHLQMHMLEEQRRSNREWIDKQDSRNRRFNSRIRQVERAFQERLASSAESSQARIADRARVNALICAGIGIGAALAGTLGGAGLIYLFTP